MSTENTTTKEYLRTDDWVYKIQFEGPEGREEAIASVKRHDVVDFGTTTDGAFWKDTILDSGWVPTALSGDEEEKES